jgi:hypothetical protein
MITRFYVWLGSKIYYYHKYKSMVNTSSSGTQYARRLPMITHGGCPRDVYDKFPANVLSMGGSD